jgi:hypothetical protein
MDGLLIGRGRSRFGSAEKIWSKCYKTFYDCNLQAKVFAPFQPSLLFVGKARNLP